VEKKKERTRKKEKKEKKRKKIHSEVLGNRHSVSVFFEIP
jgi:hypothetical protein